ncbi:MAG TPA: CD225/dispanin family protein [Thermoanaerobaculia bacterium]|nr:CD225/dispanin family protein [Thermoanaerobaculia bacterium]
MNCPNCGTSNLDNASICVNCGRALAVGAPPPPPVSPQQSYTPPPPQPRFNTGGAPDVQVPNYLVQAILVTLCCCLPFGIVSIVYAVQVNSKLAAGDVVGAQMASKNAKTWALVGFICGLIAIALWMVFGGMAFVQGVREGLHQ